MIINDPLIVTWSIGLAEQYEFALMANDLATLDAMAWQSLYVVRLSIDENECRFSQ